jgi:hypothetical protein
MSRLISPRSSSVTIAGVLALVIGGSWVVLIGGMLSVLRDADAPWVVYPGLQHKMLGAVLVLGCVSVATVIGGFGILFRRNWARILAIALAGAWILLECFFLEPFLSLPASLHIDAFMIAPFAFPLVAAIAWLALLAQRKVRTEFLPPATVRIYVNLLNKDTPRLCPAQALVWGNGLFELLPAKDYDPNIEHWEFLPGSFVHGRKIDRDGEPCLLAVSLES